jgi:hypothetical protein
MFNQYNVHWQSAWDNNWGLWESKIYREKLIELYWQEKVDYLDSQKNVPYKLDNDELYEIEQQSIIYIKDYVDEILSLDISGSLRIFLKKYIK